MFGFGPAVQQQIDRGHAPAAQETAVSSHTLVTRARALADESAIKIGVRVTKRDAPEPIPCTLSNYQKGHSYDVRDWLPSTLPAAGQLSIAAHWRSLGYHVTRGQIDYYSAFLHGLSPDLQVLPGAFSISVHTSCVGT